MPEPQRQEDDRAELGDEHRHERHVEDEGLFDRLGLAAKRNRPVLQRLDAVRSVTDAVGWGVKDAMDELWAEHVWED